jgi:tetratricopeptide (TPR) repeat protein
MNNDSRDLGQEMILPFRDRIDILFHEIKLAVMWDRPSILFAIYKSETTREKVNQILKEELDHINQKIQFIKTSGKRQFDLLSEISQCPDLTKTVFIINGLFWKYGDKSEHILNEFIHHREYFIDHNIRAVFWLFENEVSDFATNAAECWILRHRVVDFVDSPLQDQNSNQSPESRVQKAKNSLAEFEISDQSSQTIPNLDNSERAKAIRANGLLSLGLLFWRQGHQQRALKILNESMEISKSIANHSLQAQIQNALALVYAGLGNTDKAVAAYKCAISLSPESGYLWNNLGQLLAKTERSDEAINAFQNALSCSPKDFLSWDGIGHTYIKLGNYQKAISAFLNAIEIAPSYEYSWVGIGISYLETGQVEKAEASLRKALEFNIHLLEAWKYLAKCFVEQKRDFDAVSVYNRAIELNPQETELVVELGKLELKRQNYVESISAFQKSISLNPQCGEAYIKLAYSLYQIGDYETSASVYETGIPLFEEKNTRAILLNRLGDAYLKMKEYEKAIETYWQSDQLRDENQVIENNETEIIQEMDNSDSNDTAEKEQEVLVPVEGEDMNDSTQVFDLKSAAEWNAHGNSHLRAGAFNDAIVAYTKAIELAPDSCWPYIQNLAMVHYQKGKERAKVLMGKHEDPDVWEGEDELDTTTFKGYDLIQNPGQDGAFQDQVREESETNSATNMASSRIDFGMENINTTCSDNSSATIESKSGFEIQEEEPNDEIVNNIPNIEVKQNFEIPISTPPENSSEPQLVENAPQNSIDWNELGNSYTSTKNFDNAIEAYKKAIDMNPGYGQPYSNLGFIYYCLGKYEVAIQLYKDSIDRLDTKTEKVISWNKLGDCYRRLGDYENALVAYQKGSEMAPAINPEIVRGKVPLLEKIFGR